MQSKLFWVAAVLQLLASLRFTALVRTIEGARLTTDVLTLATGQRQDCWLAVAVIWVVILLQDTPYIQGLYLSGLGTLVWLLVRSLQRIGVLKQNTRE
jgi:hypothetical protein